MEKLRLADIAKAIGVSYVGDAVVHAVTTDSRNVPQGSLFLALCGDNFDGHAFIEKAFEQGAAVAVAQTPGDYSGTVFYVPDTRKALLAIARLYRQTCGVKVVGVTGSVGKTTTKEMVACVVEEGYKTLKNEANLNNEVGLSQTIFRLDASFEAAVLEMGMDGPGQIAGLSLCALPDVGVITNIGVSHIERFGTREGIRDEKLDITKGMADGSVLVLCKDNDMLRDVAPPRLRTITYGIDQPNCDVKGLAIEAFSTHTNFVIRYDNTEFDAQVPAPGRHNVYNALAAFCVGLALGIPPHRAVASLKNYRPTGMRQNIVKHNAYTIVEDCYNASPDSMDAALSTLGKLHCTGRRIAVLSDMLELGDLAQAAHLQVGRLVAQNGIDALYTVGELAQLYQQGASESGYKGGQHFASKDELFKHLAAFMQPEDVVWFKASRGMRLEDIISRIYKEC